MTVDRSRFTDTEWEIFMDGGCCYQTAYGLPYSTWCKQPSLPGNPFGYCAEHTIEEDMTMTDEQLQARRISEIATQQGWNDETLLDLAAQFIDKSGMNSRFANYLENVQRAEQEDTGSFPRPDIGWATEYDTEEDFADERE